jgi:N-acetylglucosamine kinase-like BadF-type ATPase
MAYFLGADLGSTKSHLLIADGTGRALGFAAGRGANHEVVGYDGVTGVITGLFDEVLSSAGLRGTDISGAAFGISGLDWRSEEEPQLAALAAAGVRGFPITLVNDAIVGLLAGSGDGWGIGLVSGTGCNCWGIDRESRYGRVLGRGERVGEFAGGAALVARAVWSVARALTRRGPPTRLAEAFIGYTGARDVDDLLEGFCESRYEVGASAAPLVFQVATGGDAVAIDCIAWAGQELADLALGVTRQLRFEDEVFDLVLIGSLFKGGPLLIDPLLRAVHQVAPGARAIELAGPPVIGGVVLAMKMAGLDVRGMNDRLHEATASMPLRQVGRDRSLEFQEVPG